MTESPGAGLLVFSREQLVKQLLDNCAKDRKPVLLNGKLQENVKDAKRFDGSRTLCHFAVRTKGPPSNPRYARVFN